MRDVAFYKRSKKSNYLSIFSIIIPNWIGTFQIGIHLTIRDKAVIMIISLERSVPMKKSLFGFAHLCGAVCQFDDTDSITHLLSNLLFSDNPTELENKMIKNVKNSRPELLDGNIRTDSGTFANPDLAKYLLYRFDSDRTKFAELVFRCSQHFNSHDEKSKFVPDNYYLNADNENGVIKDFSSLLSMVNTSEWIKNGVCDFVYCFKSFLSEHNYESAFAMLILFSFLNTEVFYLNWQFKRLKYASLPSESIKKEAKYIIKPYLNQSYHLALKRTTTCMNYTVDHSCIQSPMLVISSNIYMTASTSVLTFKRIRGNTYYIMLDDKYLQWLGLTSNTRITVDSELNNRCRWKLSYIEDAKAFTISPVTQNKLVQHYGVLDVPNGAIAENLPLWIFLNNTTRSQMFRLYEMIE